jgi:hypothetical protein
MDTLKDSGERREFASGSVRDKADGKGRFDLVPPEAIKGLAIQMELGAKKYGENNWALGQPIQRSFLDSALRHLMQVLEGKYDEDHLRAALWNVACAYATRERVKEGKLPKELNDLPGIPMETGH